jgi:hypothetical protein
MDIPGFSGEAALLPSRHRYAGASGAVAAGAVAPQRSASGTSSFPGWDCDFLCAICDYYPGWCFPCWLCEIWSDVFGTAGVSSGRA